MNITGKLSSLLAASLLCVTLSMNAQSGFYSTQHTDLPAQWLSDTVHKAVSRVRNLDWDYGAAMASASTMEESSESESSAMNFGPDDLWLEVTGVNASQIFLTLHGTVEDKQYQLLSKTNLDQPGEWKLGEIKMGAASTNQTDFSPVATFGRPSMFFQAHHADAVFTFDDQSHQEAIEPTNSSSGQVGFFRIINEGEAAAVAYYRISGSADNGVDYTNLSGITASIAPHSDEYIYVHPIQDDQIEFKETVTLTLIQTNSYLINPAHASDTLDINDNFPSNLFTIVVTNIIAPVGIDYSPVEESLVVSFNWADGLPLNFALINSNGVVSTNWSKVFGAPDEVKLTAVKQTVNGFTNGDVYFSSSTGIGWVSADGTRSNLTWCTLTNTVGTNVLVLRGGMYVDRSGVFSNELVAVVSDQSDTLDRKGVWRVDSVAHPILLTNILTRHLEGVITLTNDVQRWGPWAGRIVTGDEAAADEDLNPRPLIYAVEASGAMSTYALDIAPEDFDIVPPNQDLYICDVHGAIIARLSSTLLTNVVGDLLITDAGEFVSPSKLFFVRWNGTNFASRRIDYELPAGLGTHVEHATFAPITLPTLIP